MTHTQVWLTSAVMTLTLSILLSGIESESRTSTNSPPHSSDLTCTNLQVIDISHAQYILERLHNSLLEIHQFHTAFWLEHYQRPVRLYFDQNTLVFH